MITSHPLGHFAPVQVSDQAIYNRIERAASALYAVFEQVSRWLRTRLVPWENRTLARFASTVYAVDASTLDRLSRFLPWLREVTQGSKEGLAGQISALFDLRCPQWVRVQLCHDAKPIARSSSPLWFPLCRQGCCCSLIAAIPALRCWTV